MILFKEIVTLAKHLTQLKQQGLSVGFVPTMGALHGGHISLIEKSKNTCDITVSSIFVNPTQFNNVKDFEKYPITVTNDILLLEKSGCDVLFMPRVNEVYPDGFSSKYHYDLGEIEFVLEGKYRPGHFQGVCQVVHRLLNIVQPDKLFMGQKDYQQCLIVKRLVESLQLNVEVVTAGTYREASGLAMSSRNLRLNEQEKEIASGISKMLRYIKERFTTTPFSVLEDYASNYLLTSGFTKVDYVSIADADTLQPASIVKGKSNLVTLIAAYINDVRLIDNMELGN